MKKNIGVEVPQPKTECKDDKHCPFHGGLKLRGKIFKATVVASKMTKTATVQRARRHYLPKYQRYEKRKSKFRVHNPSCINAKEGDEVQIMEARPISKTKRFVIINILKENESSKK
ncbi:30S ribosomal protein S17 [Candidatus Woesearchaeota archaeon]|nr:30S ribosomal protein S17 [Candidatus Woesearchaeota archaeon]